MTSRQKWENNNLTVSMKMYFCLEVITKTECELRLKGVKANVRRLFCKMGCEWSVFHEMGQI